MRQGRASRSGPGNRKIEPRPHAIHPGGVAQLGEHTGNHTTEHGATGYRGEEMHKGRGFKAPHDAGRTIHRGGSQGRS
jgi:hypothetical protein